jgi:hypothetical protein
MRYSSQEENYIQHLSDGKLRPSTVLKTTDIRLEYQADLLFEVQQDMCVAKHTHLRLRR